MRTGLEVHVQGCAIKRPTVLCQAFHFGMRPTIRSVVTSRNYPTALHKHRTNHRVGTHRSFTVACQPETLPHCRNIFFLMYGHTLSVKKNVLPTPTVL